MTLEYIKKQVEEKTGIEDISPKGRDREKVIARCMYAALARRFTPYSFAAIGKIINRDHATVIHYIKILDVHLIYEPQLSEVYEELGTEVSNYTQEDRIKNKILNYVKNLPSSKYSEALNKLQEIEL